MFMSWFRLIIWFFLGFAATPTTYYNSSPIIIEASLPTSTLRTTNAPLPQLLKEKLHIYSLAKMETTSSITVWHMPHGISLHIAPKNSNSYRLLWGSSINQPASTTTGPSCKPAQAHHHYAPPAGPLSRIFLRFSCHHWCTSHYFRASTKSIRCNSHSMKTQAFSCLASLPETLAQISMPEMNFWVGIALASLSAPHQRCQHHSKVALLLTEDLKGLTALLTLLLITDRDAFLTTSVLLPSQLSARLFS